MIRGGEHSRSGTTLTTSRGARGVIRLSIPALLTILITLEGPSQQGRQAVHDILRSRLGFDWADVADVEAGHIVVRMLPSNNPAEFAVCGAARLSVPPDFVAAQYQHPETFEKGSDVEQVGRFGFPPRAGDLKGLGFEPDDISALKDCSPGNCAVKISARDMKRFRSEVRWDAPGSSGRALRLMRELLAARARSYLAGGDDSMGVCDDQGYRLDRGIEFRKLLHETPSLVRDEPGLEEFLERFPKKTESTPVQFLYWQKQNLEDAKPVISLNQAVVSLPATDSSRTFLVTKQIYADHFFEGSLTQIQLVPDGPASRQCTAVYLRRSSIDNLRHHGILDFSGQIRRAMYRRVQSEISWTRRRLETLYRKN